MLGNNSYVLFCWGGLVLKLFDNLSEKSREKKYKLFLDIIKPTKENTILDVGSGPGTFLEKRYINKENIIALDINSEYLKDLKKKYPKVKTKLGSALKLPFEDNSIDIVFSNAVIEHIGNYKNQQQFAKEMQRVGKKWFVTTPNKWFPFEPHFLVPFYQFVPKKVQKFLSKHVNVGRYKKGTWQDINLISARIFKKLFPTSKIMKNRITIFPETLICYGYKQ